MKKIRGHGEEEKEMSMDQGRETKSDGWVNRYRKRREVSLEESERRRRWRRKGRKELTEEKILINTKEEAKQTKSMDRKTVLIINNENDQRRWN